MFSDFQEDAGAKVGTAKLFAVMQAIYTIKLGRFDELTKRDDAGVNVLVSSMEELAQKLEGQQLEYTWMTPQLYMPLVQLLAAVVLRPQASTGTNYNLAQVHISKGGCVRCIWRQGSLTCYTMPRPGECKW